MTTSVLSKKAEELLNETLDKGYNLETALKYVAALIVNEYYDQESTVFEYESYLKEWEDCIDNRDDLAETFGTKENLETLYQQSKTNKATLANMENEVYKLYADRLIETLKNLPTQNNNERPTAFLQRYEKHLEMVRQVRAETAMYINYCLGKQSLLKSAQYFDENTWENYAHEEFNRIMDMYNEYLNSANYINIEDARAVYIACENILDEAATFLQSFYHIK